MEKQKSKSKTILCLLFLLGAPVALVAQTREPGTAQVPAGVSQTTSSGGPAADVTLTKDSLSTSVTSAPASLGPGDLLDINVFDCPELTQRVRVDSAGKIRLALIGDIFVQGMSADALGALITRKLIDGPFVKNPQVTVFVAEYAGQMAYVTGEVARPGAYPLLRSHRLNDLLSVAGGLTSRAGNSVVITRQGDSPQTIAVDLSNKDENQSNPEIMPGDSITVNQTGIVYVLGDVERPGGFLLDRRTSISVVQALALAEGTKPSASLAKARLIRTVQENRQELPLDLKKILQSKSPDILLQAGDIIFVPGSLTKGMGRRGIEVILETAGLAAVYAERP